MTTAVNPGQRQKADLGELKSKQQADEADQIPSSMVNLPFFSPRIAQLET